MLHTLPSSNIHSDLNDEEVDTLHDETGLGIGKGGRAIGSLVLLSTIASGCVYLLSVSISTSRSGAQALFATRALLFPFWPH